MGTGEGGRNVSKMGELDKKEVEINRWGVVTLMETMISFKILGTYFIVKVFVELQKQNESTVTSFAWLKTIAKVIWILMQCTDNKITYPSDLLTNKFQPSDSLLCPQKSLLTVTFQRKRRLNLKICYISFA